MIYKKKFQMNSDLILKIQIKLQVYQYHLINKFNFYMWRLIVLCLVILKALKWKVRILNLILMTFLLITRYLSFQQHLHIKEIMKKLFIMEIVFMLQAVNKTKGQHMFIVQYQNIRKRKNQKIKEINKKENNQLKKIIQNQH